MATTVSDTASTGMADYRTFFPEQRDKAIITSGHEECSQKMQELYHCMGLPKGLLPLNDMVEGGWCEETGFTWIVTSHPQRINFDKSGKLCSYDQVVTSTVSKGRVSNIRGVKAKELGFWVPVNEIYVDDSKPNNKKVVFKSIMGLSRAMPFDLYD